MGNLKQLTLLTVTLSLSLFFYPITQWLAAQPELDVTFFVRTYSLLTFIYSIFVWFYIFFLDGLPPEGKLLLTETDRRELLWRVARTPNLARQGWHWWIGRVVHPGTYVAAGLAAALLAWYVAASSQPKTFFFIALSGGTVAGATVLVSARFCFGHWATINPEVAERLLSMPGAKAAVERI